MNENKTKTYGDLKIRKQELRDKGIVGVNMEEYIQNMNAIKDAEAVLLWGIVWKDIEPEQIKPRAYKRVKYAVIAISIAVIVMIVCCGCVENTMRGAGNAVQGIGKLVTGVGTDVVRGVDGYSQEK